MAKTSKVLEGAESVDLEDTVEVGVPTQAGALVATTASLDSFNYIDYVGYFADSPEYLALTDMFVTKMYGWKSRARQLIKIDTLTKEAARLQEEFRLNKPSTSGRPTRETMRSRLRENLESLSPDVLLGIATEKGIHAADKDRVGLIEAICNVMLTN